MKKIFVDTAVRLISPQRHREHKGELFFAIAFSSAAHPLPIHYPIRCQYPLPISGGALRSTLFHASHPTGTTGTIPSAAHPLPPQRHGGHRGSCFLRSPCNDILKNKKSKFPIEKCRNTTCITTK